jgi:hypothetical protein
MCRCYRIVDRSQRTYTYGKAPKLSYPKGGRYKTAPLRSGGAASVEHKIEILVRREAEPMVESANELLRWHFDGAGHLVYPMQVSPRSTR